jgi:hypothetical protein
MPNVVGVASGNRNRNSWADSSISLCPTRHPAADRALMAFRKGIIASAAQHRVEPAQNQPARKVRRSALRMKGSLR